MSNYKGPRVTCERCGASFAQPQTLSRHRREGRCSGRRGASPTVPVRSESPRAEAAPVPVRSALAVAEPVHHVEIVPRRQESAGVFLREPGETPPLSERDRLWAKYYALRAMAVKLDAGAGTRQEEILFRRALAEYNELFDHVRAAGKDLPAQGEGAHPLPHSGDESPAWWSLV